MKKWMTPLLLIVILLAGCQGLLPPPAEPTASDSDMATQVAKILTQMPTATQPVEEPTSALPSLAPTEPQAPPAAETAVPPTETAAVVEATATQAEPTATVAQPTATQQSGTVIPTVAITPVSTLVGATPIVPTASGPTATPPATDPRNQLGSPTWNDNMDNGDLWPKGNDQYTSVSWQNGFMELQAEDEVDGWRITVPTVKNFYMEMTVKPGDCSGSDHYGMIVRVPEPHKADQGYLFGLTCDGRYSLRRWNARVGTKGEMKWLIPWTSSTAIVAGENQTNRMGLLAQEERLVLYVNGVMLDQVVGENMFNQQGGFGIFVGMDETEDFTIFVDQMSYWENPNL